MQNCIDKLFQQKKENILSVYFTAGYPAINDTVPIIEALQESGADMIEIGIPFSDPLADGVVIQQSSAVALGNGMNLKLLMGQLQGIRKKVNIPLLLMGYFNPIFQYGIEKFCNDASELGIDGLIIPDMPLVEYELNYKTLFEKCNLHNILLISPRTSDLRIMHIDELSSGFIYAVSSSSTTGAAATNDKLQKEYFERLKELQLHHPIVIGFGISNHAQFKNACQYANGAIIGSAFIRHLQQYPDIKNSIPLFIQSIRNDSATTS